MKKPVAWILALGLLPASVLAGTGPEYIIKQRARELSNQNNVRQGVRPATPAQPAQPAPGQNVAPTLTPPQQARARLEADLAGIRPESPATLEKTQQLTRDLIAASFGASKPTPQTAGKLAEALSSVLTQKLLSNVTRNRLAQDLNAVLNPANIQPAQMNDVISDIQAIFQANGIERKDAAKVSAAANTVLADTRKPAAK